MNEFKSVYFSLSFWHSLENEKKDPANITESSNATVWTTFSKISGLIKKRSRTQANYDEAIWIFFTFYYSFLLLTVFFLKEAVHERAFCSYIVIFYRGKYCTTLFFSSQNIIWRNIIYTHSLYYDRLFPMPSSGDYSWSVCQTYLFNINQRVSLTDL